MIIDLHTHTTASDGEKSPEEMVDWAIEKRMGAIAITDHETAKGAARAAVYSKDKDIEFVPGIEIGCDYFDLDLIDIHIVGLFIDPNHPTIQKVSEDMRRSRVVQKEAIIRKLNDLGYEITIDELKEEANGASFGRPHIAKILMRKYPEDFPSKGDVFHKMLDGKTGKAYVSQKKYTIGEAIEIIKEAGGISILAHPGFYFENGPQLVDKFIEEGGEGIEVDYGYEYSRDFSSEESAKLIEKFSLIAKQNKLLVSGGSDFHNEREYKDIGTHGIDSGEFERLKRALKH